MIKVISIEKVRLGMFIQELKGAWINHPFWKKSFKLDDPADLKKLKASGIKEVIIDTAKGLDVEVLVKSEAVHPDVAPTAPPVSNSQPKNAPVSLSEEQKRAKKIIKASKNAVTSMFNDVRMGKALNTESAIQLVDDITDSVDRNLGALISLVRLKNKDEYTYMHSVAVCALMIALAKELKLSEAEVKQAGLAGLLHDIGKAGIPMEVINKPSALTEEEFALVKLHPERGHAMLLQAGIADEIVLDVCLHHHEKINGLGYPHKLPGSQISLYAKMGAVCDVYDAITSNRPYKEGWEPGMSLQSMAKWTDHFESTIFEAFVKSVGIYPIGSMVKLSSGRLAVVIDQSPKSLLTPIVKVFFSTKNKVRTKVEVIDLSKAHETDSIIGHDNPVAWGIHDTHEIWSQYEMW